MDGQGHDWLQTGHPPVSQKMRKSTARKDMQDPRSIGAAGLQQSFQQATPAPSDAATGPAQQENSEQMTTETGHAFGALPLRPGHDTAAEPSAALNLLSERGVEEMSRVVEAPVTEEDASFDSAVKPETAETDEATTIGSGASGQDEEVTVYQYSNEARVYHSKYAELSQAYDDKRYAYCREGCLDLLTVPNLPRYTRIQTLQMISTIVSPEHAEEFLREADDILSEMDAAKFQVQLLKEDNEKMKRDLAVWRGDGTLDPYTPTQEWEELHEKIVQEREGADYKPAADREN